MEKTTFFHCLCNKYLDIRYDVAENRDLQGKVARRAIVFNNLAQIMQSCTNPAISQIRIRHMRHALNTHEHQFDKTPPNRAR